jgi:putative transcriptional regulator
MDGGGGHEKAACEEENCGETRRWLGDCGKPKGAIAWAEGQDVPARVSTVVVPAIDVRGPRRKLGLSQSEFAGKFGFPPATLKNWEQGRTRPDGPARVLLAVIARHPEAVEDALRKTG